ncbi:chemotaxis protein CheW [Tichowtungia aerotolerans]|uniref:Chemotaxis protein CheW n=1 Tax=Tichowtungia aerotolerans TaxID=2697043 RepID=A0A6P1M6Q9_9BACT|nr:chemotaxis protein CheW [Tichowtungia aerotolerans]QHI69702.1 chemotaxis protein CheW [Tichowtungia aerotolerans]
MTDSQQFIHNELLKRASLLAKKPVQQQNDQDRTEIMPFTLASECYAVEMRYIREIWPLTSILPIPHTPSFVLGVTNVHGEICSVIDLKQFFSLPSTGITNLNKLIILEENEMVFGILADDVLGSTFINKNDLSSVENWSGIDRTYISGITKDRLIVLNGTKILTDKRLVVNEETKT